MENNTENINEEILTQENEQKPKKSKRGKTRLIILFIVLSLLLAAVGFVVYSVGFHTPDTGADDPPPFATLGPVDTQETTSPGESEEVTAPVETDPVDPSLLPKSEQKIYNFLLVGQDRVALNTDVIIIVNFNTTTHKINVLQIPRDTYIELSTYNGKINGLFAHYYINNGRDTKKGLRMLADTLEQNLCIKIHNILHVNLNGVQKIVDAVGGVDVNFPSTLTLIDNNGQKIVYNAGVHHLDGYMSEVFIRHRSTYVQADIGRMDAQKIFMSALLQKVKSSFNLSTITKLADVVFDNVITDVTVTDGIFFAKELLSVNMNEINFMSMVGKNAMSNPNGTGLSLYVMVRKNMCEMVDKYFNIYDFPITDTIFDPNRVFTSTKRYPHLNKHYTNQNVDTNDPYSAEDINDNSISIPRT